MPSPQTLSITGMTCGSCAAKVSARLLEHPDILHADVTVNPGKARIIAQSPLSDWDVTEWLRPLGRYSVPVDEAPSPAAPAKNAQTYKPLLILLAYLIAVTGLVASPFGLMHAMSLFMGGFFIAFSFFKMLDLRGFADAYRSYDIVAKKWPAYGLVYPFIELALGLAYIGFWQPLVVNAVTAVVMAVSLAGVLRAVLSKQTIRCACLGTVFNLPMSTVTIIEDGVMLGMAVIGLVAGH